VISVDTNVFIALMGNEPVANQLAKVSLGQAVASGPVCACGAVFSELLGLPGRNAEVLRRFFDAIGVGIEWTMEEVDGIAAGTAYQGYVARRRAGAGGLPRRMAADFLIGAHALVRGYTLLTADRRLYHAAFPALPIRTI
jgi:hypothetical protein